MLQLGQREGGAAHFCPNLFLFFFSQVLLALALLTSQPLRVSFQGDLKCFEQWEELLVTEGNGREWVGQPGRTSVSSTNRQINPRFVSRER